MPEPRRVGGFLLMADDDADAAIALAGIGHRYGAFHCQQAAEKLIKALLLRLGLEAGVEHRLDMLLARLPDAHPMKADLGTFTRYTPFATTYRYPRPSGDPPNEPDAATIIADANRLKVLIAAARRSGKG